MATEPFKLTRDFRRVQWGPTLQVNLLRSMAAGVIFGVIGLIAFFASMSDHRIGTQWPRLLSPLIWPLMMPLVYLVFFLPLGIVGGVLASMDDIVGLIGAWFVLVAALVVTIGDPLVFFLHRAKPKWVPIDRYPFFGFCMILYVLRPAR